MTTHVYTPLLKGKQLRCGDITKLIANGESNREQ